MWKTLLPFIKNWRRKASTCYSLSFWWWPFWQAWGRISLWLWFAFPQQLAMLSIFSCTCWPSVCVLWKNLFQVLCPFFNWFFSFFFFPLMLSCMSSLCILDINVLSDISFAFIFSLSALVWLSFKALLVKEIIHLFI